MNGYAPQILEDSDDDFDPKTEDIHQYCEIIGLDPTRDSGKGLFCVISTFG